MFRELQLTVPKVKMVAFSVVKSDDCIHNFHCQLSTDYPRDITV